MCRVLTFPRKKLSVIRSPPICMLLPFVINHPGSLDRLYDAETNGVSQLRTRTHSVSTSSSFAASALSDVADQHLALLSKQAI